MSAARHQLMGWSGLFLGLIGWYGAHELSFYLLGFNCAGRQAPVAIIHGAGAALSLAGAWVSSRQSRTGAFAGLVGMGAGLLFAFVILAQGVALLFYAGCER